MRISFDLDDVLFVSPEKYETEPPLRFPLNRLFPERLRKGTPELIHKLQQEGFEVWVYTSSFRTETYIRALFRHYGIHFDQIVNGTRHRDEVQRNRDQILPQKMPSFYRISLHIDDDESIHQNGIQYGFKTLCIYKPDEHWVEKVLHEARRVRSLEERNQQNRKQVTQS